MKKYQTEFKLEVVKSFLAGEGGAKPWGLLPSVSRTSSGGPSRSTAHNSHEALQITSRSTARRTSRASMWSRSSPAVHP